MDTTMKNATNYVKAQSLWDLDIKINVKYK